MSQTTVAAERRSARAQARETELLAAALREDSNLEMDWLWLAMQLADTPSRRFCLRRALRINPWSELARAELERLDRAERPSDAIEWTLLRGERG